LFLKKENSPPEQQNKKMTPSPLNPLPPKEKEKENTVKSQPDFFLSSFFSLFSWNATSQLPFLPPIILI
jgi:hypothetical protein